MKRTPTIMIVALLLGACAQYALLEPDGPRTIGDAYTVEPQITWNTIDFNWIERWTVDGASLEVIDFIALKDESLLFPADPNTRKDKFPRYREGMTANDVMEFVVDSMAAGGGGAVEASGLRPMAFGSHDGFRFEMTLITTDGLDKDAIVAGTVIGKKLHLIIYSGARMHYFPKYRDTVEGILASIQPI